MLIHPGLKFGLRRRAGCRQAVGMTIMVGTRPGNDAVNEVAIANRRVQWPQHHGTDRLARHKTIGAFIEGTTTIARREHSKPTGQSVKAGRGVDENAPGQRQVTFTAVNALASQVNR